MSKTINTFNYRVYGTVTSEVLSSMVFYYMIDFGTGKDSGVGGGRALGVA